MRHKLILIIALILLVCTPFAFAANLNDLQGSEFLHELSLEEFILYGGLSWTSIGTYQGETCVKPGVKPQPVDLPVENVALVSLDDLEMPDYGFVYDAEFIMARKERMKHIVKMMDDAFNDPAVQDYDIFKNGPVQYTNAGIFFNTITEAMEYGNEALQIVGLLADSAYDGALWLDYGYATNSANIKFAFSDYVQFNLLFNGLMNQIEDNSELENAVNYAADVLGSQLSNSDGLANVAAAHEQMDSASASMDSASDYFSMADDVAASGNTALAQRLDFLGMMNMAQAFYSLGEAYKLKQLVLFMILDGTFRSSMKMKQALGTYLGPPCDPIPNVCPVGPNDNPWSAMLYCCKGCPPAIYILTSNEAPCVMTGKGQIPPGNPGYVPLPPGAPAPSGIGGAAVAAVEDYSAMYPMYQFDESMTEDLKSMRANVPKFPAVPADYKPARMVVAQANLEASALASDSLVEINVPDMLIQPSSIKTRDGSFVSVTVEKGVVALRDESGRLVKKIESRTPNSLAADLKLRPENYEDELGGLVVKPKEYYLGNNLVGISSNGDVIDSGTGDVVKKAGKEFGQKHELWEQAQDRMVLLSEVAELEKTEELTGNDRRYYSEKRRAALYWTISIADRKYQFELNELGAKDTTFEERTKITEALNARANADLIKIVEDDISDARVNKYARMFLEESRNLMDLLKQRTVAQDYDKITELNAQILSIVYDAGLADYYIVLRDNNR